VQPIPLHVVYKSGTNAAGVHQDACTECGDCCGGCNIGAKTTVASTYLADAAAFGEVIVNATSGAHALEALDRAGPAHLAGKIVIDVSNPLDFSRGFPPMLTVSNTDSLGEQIQRAFPDAHVVKTLNTVAAEVMVDPAGVPGGHTLFLCGNDPGSKAVVLALLGDLGWPSTDVLDLGDITACRGTEAYLLLWVRLFQATGTRLLNVRVVAA